MKARQLPAGILPVIRLILLKPGTLQSGVCYIKLVYDHLKLVQELHPCGAETIYMDPDYLQEVVKGMLRVHVRNAVGLQLQGEKKECNAFVTVAVGPSAGRHYPPASGIEQNTALC